MLFVNERSFKREKAEVGGLSGNNKTNGSKSLRDELRSVKIRLEVLRLINLHTYFTKEFKYITYEELLHFFMYAFEFQNGPERYHPYF